MESRDHLDILQQVSDGSIPSRVDAGSNLPMMAIADLVAGGYLTAAHALEGRDPAWLNLMVTPQGRQHLRRLRSLHPPRSIDEGFRRMVPLWLRVALGFLIAVSLLFGRELMAWPGIFH